MTSCALARHVLCAAAFALLGLPPGPSVAEATRHGPLIPQEVVLYIHADIADRSFVDPLLCKLERELAAPVIAVRSEFAIDRSHHMNRSQVDADKLARAFAASIDGQSAKRTFRHLVIAPDLTDRGYNYLFARRFEADALGRPMQVISTSRLSDGPPGSERTAALVDRLYKIVLRGVAHAAGYGSRGCVLGDANNRPTFDQKDLELCPDDRARLVRAGLIRERPRDCSPVVSWLSPAAAR